MSGTDGKKVVITLTDAKRVKVLSTEPPDYHFNTCPIEGDITRGSTSLIELLGIWSMQLAILSEYFSGMTDVREFDPHEIVRELFGSVETAEDILRKLLDEELVTEQEIQDIFKEKE